MNSKHDHDHNGDEPTENETPSHEYDGVDLTPDGSGGCPHCGGVTLVEDNAGYYSCPECLGVWAGDPEDADLHMEPLQGVSK